MTRNILLTGFVILLTQPAVFCAPDGSREKIGLLEYDDSARNTACLKPIVAHFEAIGCAAEVIRLNHLREENRRRSYRVVFIGNKELMTLDDMELLRLYVREGGLLILMGRTATSLDVDKDGKWTAGIDKSVQNPNDGLSDVAGGHIALTGKITERIRVYNANPVTLGLTVDKWLDYPPNSGRAVQLKATTGKVLAGVYLAPASTPPGSKTYKYWGPKFGGEYPFIVVNKAGKGACILVANDLFDYFRSPYIIRLVENMAAPAVAEWIGQAFGHLSDPHICYDEEDNLIFNGGFEDSREICELPPAEYGAREKNKIKNLPYALPLGWGYRAKEGAYQGMASSAEKHSGNYSVLLKHVGAIADVATGWTVWDSISSNIRLKPSATYRLSAYAKAIDAKKVRITIMYNLADGGKRNESFSAGEGSFDWKLCGGNFTTFQGGSTGDIQIMLILEGTGEAWFDDVSLTEQP